MFCKCHGEDAPTCILNANRFVLQLHQLKICVVSALISTNWCFAELLFLIVEFGKHELLFLKFLNFLCPCCSLCRNIKYIKFNLLILSRISFDRWEMLDITFDQHMSADSAWLKGGKGITCWHMLKVVCSITPLKYRIRLLCSSLNYSVNAIRLQQHRC